MRNRIDFKAKYLRPLLVDKTTLAACFSLIIFLTADFTAGRIFTHIYHRQKLGRDQIEADFPQIKDETVPYHHTFKPNQDMAMTWAGYVYRIKTNSLGFRDARIRPVSPVPAQRRILLLGDSFTEGVGYDFEKTFPGLLQEALGKDGIEVLNGGITLYCPLIYYKKTQYLLETVGLKFDELVVFLDAGDIQDEVRGFYEDETGRVRMRTGEEDQKENPWSVLLKQGLKDNSILGRTLGIIHRSFTLPQKSLKRPSVLWTVNKKLYEEFGREGLQKAEEHMNALRALLQKHGIQLTLAVYPWPDHIFYQDQDSLQVRFWKNWAQAHQATFVNFFPDFINGRPYQQVLWDYFIPGDVHWNEKGHRLISESFLKQWRQGHAF